MTEPPFAPRPVSDRVTHLDLTGKAILVYAVDGQSFLIKMEGSSDMYLPIFTAGSMINDYIKQSGRTQVSVKQITDGPDFLSSLPYWYSPGVRLRVIIDPHRTPQGTIRFQEVLRSDA